MRTERGFLMNTRVIIVSGLHADLTEDHLYDLFESYGCIEDARLFVDERDGRSLGYGEVVYVSFDCARRALREAEGIEIWGSKLLLRPVSYYEGGDPAEAAEGFEAERFNEGPIFNQEYEPSYGREYEEEYDPELRFVSEITLPLWAREEQLDDELESA